MPIEKTPSTNACRRVKPKIETRAKKIADENHEQVTSCGNGPAQTLMLLCGVRRHRAYLNTLILLFNPLFPLVRGFIRRVSMTADRQQNIVLLRGASIVIET